MTLLGVPGGFNLGKASPGGAEPGSMNMSLGEFGRNGRLFVVDLFSFESTVDVRGHLEQ